MAITRKSEKMSNQVKSQELVKATEEAKATIELSVDEKIDLASMADSNAEKEELEQEMLAIKTQREAIKMAKKTVNKEVPVRYLTSRPASAKTEATMQLHMRQSYSFLVGRKNPKPELLGLFAATQRVKTIAQGYYAGCPYAAWYLIKIEEEIRGIRAIMADSKKEAQALVNHATSICFGVFESKSPSDVELSFREPYGYHFAELLKMYDDVLRIMAKYKEKRFISNDEYYGVENKMSRPLRRLFGLTNKWYFVGSEAVQEQTAVSLQAEASMGVLPDSISEGALPNMINPKIIENNDSNLKR